MKALPPSKPFLRFSAAVAALGLAVLVSSPQDAFAAFGVTDSGGFLTVDSGAGLVFKLNKSNGDITSMKFNNGPELNDQSKFSQISSGLGSATVTWGLSPSGTTALI